MANKQFINNKNNVVPNDGAAFHSIWVCAVYADRPTSGLSVGDLMVVVNDDAIYVADSTTTWVGGVNLGQIKVPSLFVGDYAGGAYHLVTSAAATPQLIAIPNGGGSFVTEDYAQPLDNKTRLRVLGSGTGTVWIAEYGGSNAYGAIGMAGDVSTANYNLASSPGDTNLYISRPVGKDIYIDNGTGVQQIQIFSTAPIQSIPTLAGNGADPPASLAMGKVNRTAQNASIAAFNLTNGTPAGLYRISYFLRCTTSDVTAGTISFSTTYTDSVGATTETSATAALTSTANRANGTFIVDLASGNITGSTTLTGIAGTSQYKLRVRVEYLG